MKAIVAYYDVKCKLLSTLSSPFHSVANHEERTSIPVLDALYCRGCARGKFVDALWDY